MMMVIELMINVYIDHKFVLVMKLMIMMKDQEISMMNNLKNKYLVIIQKYMNFAWLTEEHLLWLMMNITLRQERYLR